MKSIVASIVLLISISTAVMAQKPGEAKQDPGARKEARKILRKLRIKKDLFMGLLVYLCANSLQ